MTINNEKMSERDIMAILLNAGILDADSVNPFVVGFSTHPYPALREWSGGCECSAGYKCDECKYDDWMAELQENDSKAFSQHLQDTNKAQVQAKQLAQLEQTCAMPATAKFPIEMKMPKGWTVQSFMATSPSKENVMDMCCQIANLYNCDITDTFFFEMFESLLALRTEGLFFDDRYSAGYHDACLLGVVNWKIAKGNEKLIALNANFDKFVEVAHTLNAPKERLEKLFPYHK